MSKFRDFEEEDDDGEEADWKDSYSDLMTDLLAVFVLLLSFAMINQGVINQKATEALEQKIVELSVISITDDSSGILPDNAGNGNSGIFENDSNKGDSDYEGNQEDDKLVESINSYISEEGISDELSISKEGDEVLLRVAASVLFDTGRTEINSKADPILKRISEVFSLYGKNIKTVRIEGHTDNVPIHRAGDYDNWDLSTSRAVSVLKKVLEMSDLKPEQLSAVGYGEFRPIAENTTEEGKALNRRVDFIIETFE